MEKNYRLIMQSKKINELFSDLDEDDIFNVDTMKSQLQVTWKDLTYEELEQMEDTISKEINNNNSINSLASSILGVIMTLTVGFIGAYVGIIATSADDMYKAKTVLIISGSIILLLLMAGVFYSIGSRIHKRNLKSLTIITILKDLKKQQG